MFEPILNYSAATYEAIAAALIVAGLVQALLLRRASKQAHTLKGLVKKTVVASAKAVTSITFAALAEIEKTNRLATDTVREAMNALAEADDRIADAEGRVAELSGRVDELSAGLQPGFGKGHSPLDDLMHDTINQARGGGSIADALLGAVARSGKPTVKAFSIGRDGSLTEIGPDSGGDGYTSTRADLASEIPPLSALLAALNELPPPPRFRRPGFNPALGLGYGRSLRLGDFRSDAKADIRPPTRADIDRILSGDIDGFAKSIGAEPGSVTVEVLKGDGEPVSDAERDRVLSALKGSAGYGPEGLRSLAEAEAEAGATGPSGPVGGGAPAEYPGGYWVTKAGERVDGAHPDAADFVETGKGDISRGEAGEVGSLNEADSPNPGGVLTLDSVRAADRDAEAARHFGPDSGQAGTKANVEGHSSAKADVTEGHAPEYSTRQVPRYSDDFYKSPRAG